MPLTLTAYGYTSFIIDPIRNFDYTIKDQWGSAKSTTVDDYLIYAPLLTDAALSLAGIQSKNQYRDKVAIYVLATIINGILVYPVKELIHRQRPDDSNFRSFPSGHTSNAFVGAEFFRKEYNHIIPVLSGAGYLTATATGYLRIHNNKHWFSDIVAGAGIGILSTRLTYFVYPRLKNLFKKEKKNVNPAFE